MPCKCDEKDVFISPGRIEIIGNHTDHQGGVCLSASIDRAITGTVFKNNDNIIKLIDENGCKTEVDLNSLSAKPEEKGRTAALIRGIAKGFSQSGITPCGFTAFISSDLPIGVGLSSSAAIEMLIARAILCYTGASFDDIKLAKICKFAENEYYGKPCGLLDQLTVAIGGAVFSDYKDDENTVAKKIPAKIPGGLEIYLLRVGTSHSDKTADYAAIYSDMENIAHFYGKKALRFCNKEELIADMGILKERAGGRACLRALHFFEECERVKAASDALLQNDKNKFLNAIKGSGESSLIMLQNAVSCADMSDSSMLLGYKICKDAIGEKGAYRLCGGGFGGCILVFCEKEVKESFKKSAENVFGEGSVINIKISEKGTYKR